MDRSIQLKVILRLAALSILVFCLIIVSRNTGKARMKPDEPVPPNFIQSQAPIIVEENQPGTPLTISAARPSSPDPQNTEITYNLTNVFGKTITAFVISQEVEAGGTQRRTVSLYNLELTDTALLPNQTIIDYSTYETLSEEQHHVTLSVQYVRFSDGTTWGIDKDKSSERIAGQRTAALILGNRLLKILKNGNSGDVVSAIEAGMVNTEPPSARSPEWKEGFRLGCASVVRRLKEVQSKGGGTHVDAELHRLAESFKGAQ